MYSRNSTKVKVGASNPPTQKGTPSKPVASRRQDTVAGRAVKRQNAGRTPAGVMASKVKAPNRQDVVPGRATKRQNAGRTDFKPTAGVATKRQDTADGRAVKRRNAGLTYSKVDDSGRRPTKRMR